MNTAGTSPTKMTDGADTEPGQLAASQEQKGRRAIAAKLILLLGACLVAFLIGELTVRLIWPGYPGYRTPQIVHRPDPDLGFEMIPDQNGFTFASPATINSHGLRGPEFELEKAPGQFRVLCLGDSFTFGVGVRDEVTFAQQLETSLMTLQPQRDPQVINAGVQRYATYQEIDWLQKQGLGMQPDAVVLAVYPNDLLARPQGPQEEEYENEREKAFRSFRARFPWLYLPLKNIAVVERTKLTMDAVLHPVKTETLEGESTNERIEQAWTSVGKDLKTFYETAQECGFQPLVVAIPDRLQVMQDFPDSHYPRRLIEACDDLGLEHVDLLEEFKSSLNQDKDPYLPWDNHMSVTGHSIVADAIAERLDFEETGSVSR